MTSEPSGSGSKDSAPRTPPGTVTIRCREDGPFVVEMPAESAEGAVQVRVTDHQGNEFRLPEHKRAVALCRCGQSQQKPFCDGSHKAAGFKAGETASPE